MTSGETYCLFSRVQKVQVKVALVVFAAATAAASRVHGAVDVASAVAAALLLHDWTLDESHGHGGLVARWTHGGRITHALLLLLHHLLLLLLLHHVRHPSIHMAHLKVQYSTV